MNDKSQSGNVLFYILIAVALLAALTFAVAQSGRGSTKQVSEERARLLATEIIEYANIVSAAVTQLKLRGCTDTEISFEGAQSHDASDYVNPNAPTDNFCHIFDVNAGGVIYKNPPAEARIVSSGPRPYECNGASFYNRECENYYFTGAGAVIGVGNDGGASANRELLMYFTNISEQICTAINALLDIDGIPTDPDAVWGQDRTFKGGYVNFNQIDAPELEGITSGCVQDSTNPDYSFYKVLIAR